MTYRSTEHLHNFACWTAAAAVRRGFTTNKIIADAIEDSNLQVAADELIKLGGDYEKIHTKLCNALLTYFEGMEEKVIPEKRKAFISKCTFGRMAKIVSIYMKTYAVLPNLNNPELKNVLDSIYPPIDQILLDGIAREKERFLSIAKKYKWSKANDQEYYKLKEAIEKEQLDFNWTLEEFWNGHREETE
jgi:hypothetical protein